MIIDKHVDGEPYLTDVLDFGQGDDDVVAELFDGLAMMCRGYTKLFDHGENEWYLAMNQGTDFDDLMKEQIERIDWETFEDVLNKMIIIMIGTYAVPSKFFNAIAKVKELGIGYRPNSRKDGDEKNGSDQ